MVGRCDLGTLGTVGMYKRVLRLVAVLVLSTVCRGAVALNSGPQSYVAEPSFYPGPTIYHFP